MTRSKQVLLAALALAVPTMASATLRPIANTWLYGPTAVWTNGTTSALFHPLSEPMGSAGLVEIRVTYELSEDSGDCELRPALRYSDEGVTWNAPKEVPVSYTHLTLPTSDLV